MANTFRDGADAQLIPVFMFVRERQTLEKELHRELYARPTNWQSLRLALDFTLVSALVIQNGYILPDR